MPMTSTNHSSTTSSTTSSMRSTHSATTVSSTSISTNTSSVLIDSQGSGGTADLNFRVSGPWRLTASWNCITSGQDFELELKTRQGKLVTRISGTRESQVEKEFALAGSYRIHLTSGCSWHVLVHR
jgi:hypothetical protein